jgi:NADH:ubiquinone oxidoreductase subunit 5 (subunit L)/multisubunit Na+/H+ antiporter MnhA subunit
MTLMVASLSALVETDGKKVVALSTLRQLGLIFVSLSIGRVSICLIHILIHALAKANLFLIVGTLLHRRFSQQDTRFLSSGSLNLFSLVRLRISLFRLVGLTFTAGFFSKEQILLGHYFVINRIPS